MITNKDRSDGMTKAESVLVISSYLMYDFTDNGPIQPQRHQDTKFIKDEAQALQSQHENI